MQAHALGLGETDRGERDPRTVSLPGLPDVRGEFHIAAPWAPDRALEALNDEEPREALSGARADLAALLLEIGIALARSKRLRRGLERPCGETPIRVNSRSRAISTLRQAVETLLGELLPYSVAEALPNVAGDGVGAT